MFATLSTTRARPERDRAEIAKPTDRINRLGKDRASRSTTLTRCAPLTTVAAIVTLASES